MPKGRLEVYHKADRLANGIDVDISTVSEMIEICKYLGMDHVKYLGDVDVGGAKKGTYDRAYEEK